MGQTGAGKSNFIEKLVGASGDQSALQPSSKSLKPDTNDIQLTRILNNPTYGDRIVIVDTPGFDNGHNFKSDTEILRIVGKWLEKAYKGQLQANLAGIFYLHPISSNRMTTRPGKNLPVLKSLTGDAAAGRVVFITTMWDLARDETRREVFRKRQEQLTKQFWQVSYHKSSIVVHRSLLRSG
ncbi:hypothetical protein BJ165DRAFT_1518895 [Panaeolus papilionaceus]|nr:hypothetical protein BJ165DRAFT_1518895 [Panaeolus papilionaceus]